MTCLHSPAHSGLRSEIPNRELPPDPAATPLCVSGRLIIPATLLGIILAASCLRALGEQARLLSTPDPGQPRAATGGGDSWSPIMTPDGRFVLFASTANNLATVSNGLPIPASIPAHQNIFLRDRQKGSTVLVSVNLSGVAGGNGDSLPADISTNGRYALFESTASDLVQADTNNAPDVFVRDLVNGTTILVSIGTNGACANGGSRSSVFTPDGRYVAFVSDADNLVLGDTNQIADVFVRDLQNGTTLIASTGAVSTNSTVPAGTSESPVITPDGRYVAFLSTASNLVSQVGGTPEIYVRDLIAGTTTWASAGAHNALLSIIPRTNAFSYNHSISADGKFIAYEASLDPALASLYPPRPGLILRYGLQSGLTDLVSTNANIPVGAYQDVRSLDMTPDGRFVAFIANAVDNSGNTTAAMVWDGQTSVATLASGTTNGTIPSGSVCESPVLDPSGRFLAFVSSATGLVTNALMGNNHIYLRDLQGQNTMLVDAGTNSIGSTLAVATIPRLTADGRSVAFESPDASLATGDSNRRFDIFVRDTMSNTTEAVSVHDPSLGSETPNGSSTLASGSVSFDGRYLALASDADNMVGGDTNECRDVFIRDLASGSNALVSVDRFGVASGNGVSTEPSISLDGRYVAFTSSATNLVAGDSNRSQDVFVRDLQSAVTSLVSFNGAGTGPANSHSYSPQISGDGRFVMFLSVANNIVTGAVGENLYARDQQAAKTYALTKSGLALSAITRDGRFVAFADTAGAANGRIQVWSSQTAATLYTAITAPGIVALSISPDGNRLAYWAGTNGSQLFVADASAKTNWSIEPSVPASHSGLRFSADSSALVYASSATAGDSSQVYLYDLPTRSRLLVSSNSGGTAGGNAASDSPDISPDGRFVAYRSSASDIVPGDNNDEPDIFLFDRVTGSTILLSTGSSASASADNRSLAPFFSCDGQTLFFQSWASDLTAHDFNQSDDVFGSTLPYVGIASNAGQGFGLSWPVLPGRNYRVEFKNSLNDASWTQLDGVITNIGNKCYFKDSSPASGHRFYRMQAY